MKDSKRTKWNDKKIVEEINSCMKTLNLNRMPTRSELENINRGDLCNAIGKSAGYYGWAKKLGLKTKMSETTKGKRYEYIAERMLKAHFKDVEVLQMSQNYPFDILVDGTVKIDVKVGTVHNGFDVPAYTFRTGKKYGSCDIYLCFGLNKKQEISDIFIIPTAMANVTTINVCIGGNSKYLRFSNRWDIISEMMTSNKKLISIV